MLDVRLVLDISAIFTDILDKHSEISGTQWRRQSEMCPWSTKAVISNTGIFVAIDNNTLYGSKLYIFLLCQKSLGY